MFRSLTELGMSFEKYRFISQDARARFSAGTEKPTGDVILTDVVKLINKYHGTISLTPRSRYTPQMLVGPMEKFLTKRSYDPEWHAFNRAVARVNRMFYVGKLKPAPLGSSNFDASKSSGAPFFCKKGDVFKESLEFAEQILEGKRQWQPVTVYHRGKDTEKVRPVFGYPFEMILIEEMFFHPYQDELLLHHNPYMGGSGPARIAGAVNEIRLKSESIMMLDFSGFDGSISALLISKAFDIIKNNFVLTDEEEKAYTIMVKYFLTCPILLPGGEVVRGKRSGVPSGSQFTQLVDSIVNAIFVEYLAYRTKVKLSRFYVMGDDSLIGVKGASPSLARIANIAKELGLEINVKKSRVVWSSRDDLVHFLGHHWNRGMPTRDVSETLERLVAPERYDARMRDKSSEEYHEYLQERIEQYSLDNCDGYTQSLLMQVSKGLSDARYPYPFKPPRNFVRMRFFNTTLTGTQKYALGMKGLKAGRGNLKAELYLR